MKKALLVGAGLLLVAALSSLQVGAAWWVGPLTLLCLFVLLPGVFALGMWIGEKTGMPRSEGRTGGGGGVGG